MQILLCFSGPPGGSRQPLRGLPGINSVFLLVSEPTPDCDLYHTITRVYY
jgi:hypothetical protein